MLMPMSGDWRVAVTRDEGLDGPLATALRSEGFQAVICPVAIEAPAADPAAVAAVAGDLERFDWVVAASQRAVRALAGARGRPWPKGVRTAAVGRETAAALVAAGADPAPLVAAGAGADALWAVLERADRWPGRRVLAPTIAGGRRGVIDGLRAAGALVTEIEVYRMDPRPERDVVRDWRAAAPDAVVVASPSAGRLLVGAVGAPALRALRAVVAMGETTASALREAGLEATVPPAADFPSLARHLAGLRAAGLASHG
jgi:uroporphyrinogen-III synthase